MFDFEIERADMELLLDDLGITRPANWDGVLGILERCGSDASVAVARPLPPPGPLKEDETGVAELPFAWALNWLHERNPDAMFMDGPFEDCFVGVWFQPGRLPLPVYDRALIIHRLALDTATSQADASLDYGSAVEHFEFNIGGAYIGEGTPAFLTRYVD